MAWSTDVYVEFSRISVVQALANAQCEPIPPPDPYVLKSQHTLRDFGSKLEHSPRYSVVVDACRAKLAKVSSSQLEQAAAYAARDVTSSPLVNLRSKRNRKKRKWFLQSQHGQRQFGSPALHVGSRHFLYSFCQLTPESSLTLWLRPPGSGLPLFVQRPRFFCHFLIGTQTSTALHGMFQSRTI